MSPRSGGWNVNSARPSRESGTNGIIPVSASGLTRENTILFPIRCWPSTSVGVMLKPSTLKFSMLKCIVRNTASDTSAV